jgi:hypothetical protein
MEIIDHFVLGFGVARGLALGGFVGRGGGVSLLLLALEVLLLGLLQHGEETLVIGQQRLDAGKDALHRRERQERVTRTSQRRQKHLRAARVRQH